MNQTSLSRSYYLNVLIICILFLLSSCSKGPGDESEVHGDSEITAGTHINQVNQPPNAIITKPLSNITLTKGDTYTFNGKAVDPEGDTNLLLIWDFDGYVLNSTGSSKTVVFDRLGSIVVTLKAKDSNNLWDPSPATLTVTVIDSQPKPQTQNQAPNGTIDTPVSLKTIYVGDSLFFSGSGVDPEGSAVTYAWDFSSSGITISNKKTPGVKTFNRVGVFVVSLIVKDDKGLADSTPATVKVTVNEAVPVNTAPNSIITAPNSNYTIVRGDSIFFSGSGTDPEGGAVTYAWDFAASGIANSNLKFPGLKVFNRVGVFDVSLVVTDDKGLADPTPAIVRITVNEMTSTNTAPDSIITAPASNYTINRGDSIFFSGTGLDPDGDVNLKYLWEFDGVTPNSQKQIPGNVVFNTVGFYTIKFTVTDSKGLADPSAAVKYVYVTDSVITSAAPESTIESPPADVKINVGDSMRFVGSGVTSNPNVSLKYFWQFDGVIPNSLAQNPGQIIFDKAGVYRISLTVTDSTGAVDATPDVRIITVGNSIQNIPDSKILTPIADMAIEVGTSVSFTGEGVGTGALNYLWNFDGAAPNSTLKSPGSITFDNTGIFNVSLRVEDESGQQDPTPDYVQIIVQNSLLINEPPNGFIASPSMNLTINEGDSISFSGLGLDPDGDNVSYRWDFNGAVLNKVVQSPGLVQFDNAGVYQVKLIVKDEGGLVDPSPPIRVITVKSATPGSFAPNGSISTPVADVIITQGDSLILSGVATDPDNNTPLTYFWNLDGAAPNSTRLNPGEIIFSNPGTYRVQFSVMDNGGLTDPTPDERIIVVEPTNGPTTNNIAPNAFIVSPTSDKIIFVGDSINFSALGTDADGNTPINFRWNMDGVMPNPMTQNPGLVTFNRVGTYRIVLTVTDSLGLSDATPEERIITVRSAQTSNSAPNGSIISPAGNQTITVGDTLYFTGTGIDPDNNEPLRFYWDFNGVQPNKLGANAGNVTFNKVGVFDVYLMVVDSLGLSDVTPSKVTITVEANKPASNLPPSGKIDTPSSNRIIDVGQSLLFSASGVDPENGALSYAWDFDNSGIAASTQRSPGTKTFNTAGVYQVKMTVTDNKGLADPTPQVVTVTVNQPEVIVSDGRPNGIITSPSAGVLTLNAGDSYTFKAIGVDPEGDAITYYHWSFKNYDMANKSGSSITVKFDNSGLVTVQLRVKDATGLWDMSVAEVVVTVN